MEAHQDSKYHAVLFPFMAKGHNIPLLHLARLLLRCGVAVTVFTTPGNHSFVATSLSDTAAFIIDLPFPQNVVPEIPNGVESTDKLPSMSLFAPFALSTKHMQADFEKALESLLPHVDFMVSDGFLWWTLDSAMKYGLPRLVFFGMSIHSGCVCKTVLEHRLISGPEGDDEPIILPEFPWIEVTRNDFEPTFTEPEPSGPLFELNMVSIPAAINSYGTITNSFYELEPVFADYINKDKKYHWCVGPLCLAEPPRVQHEPLKKPSWIKWLDQKLDQGSSVLYVAFGSQAEISPQQLKEIAVGLEESKVNFLWVIRSAKGQSELGDGFEERIKDRGIIVREWVDQREILMHQSVQGFLSHCGWNSVLESICAGVPILAWPMMAEQHLNARMVVEEIKVGLRVETCNGSVRGFVKSEGLKKMVQELMEGEIGKEVRKKVKEYEEMAKTAMEEGSGSSWRTLNTLIDEICRRKKEEAIKE